MKNEAPPTLPAVRHRLAMDPAGGVLALLLGGAGTPPGGRGSSRPTRPHTDRSSGEGAQRSERTLSSLSSRLCCLSVRVLMVTVVKIRGQPMAWSAL
jgi:hypothetical protein